jgi:hypothetical protein
VISLHEKREHFFEIQETASRHGALREEIDARAAAYDTFSVAARPRSETRS